MLPRLHRFIFRDRPPNDDECEKDKHSRDAKSPKDLYQNELLLVETLNRIKELLWPNDESNVSELLPADHFRNEVEILIKVGCKVVFVAKKHNFSVAEANNLHVNLVRHGLLRRKQNLRVLKYCLFFLSYTEIKIFERYGLRSFSLNMA